MQISHPALIKRINRRLTKSGSGEMLRTLRGDRFVHSIGRYYVEVGGIVTNHFVEPAQLAVELGCLKIGEVSHAI